MLCQDHVSECALKTPPSPDGLNPGRQSESNLQVHPFHFH